MSLLPIWDFICKKVCKLWYHFDRNAMSQISSFGSTWVFMSPGLANFQIWHGCCKFQNRVQIWNFTGKRFTPKLKAFLCHSNNLQENNSYKVWDQSAKNCTKLKYQWKTFFNLFQSLLVPTWHYPRVVFLQSLSSVFCLLFELWSEAII